MRGFWKLFQQSVVMQGFLTLLLWGAIIYLTVTGQEVPNLLVGAGSLIMGFWFDNKSRNKGAE